MKDKNNEVVEGFSLGNVEAFKIETKGKLKSLTLRFTSGETKKFDGYAAIQLIGILGANNATYFSISQEPKAKPKAEVVEAPEPEAVPVGLEA